MSLFVVICVACACLTLASNVMVLAFKAKNDMSTTWGDVKNMALSNGLLVVGLMVVAIAQVLS